MALRTPARIDLEVLPVGGVDGWRADGGGPFLQGHPRSSVRCNHRLCLHEASRDHILRGAPYAGWVEQEAKVQTQKRVQLCRFLAAGLPTEATLAS